MAQEQQGRNLKNLLHKYLPLIPPPSPPHLNPYPLVISTQPLWYKHSRCKILSAFTNVEILGT